MLLDDFALRDFIDRPLARRARCSASRRFLSWGTIFYTPVLIVPLIAAERGWSISFAMGGFSVGLLVAGLVVAVMSGARSTASAAMS